MKELTINGTNVRIIREEDNFTIRAGFMIDGTTEPVQQNVNIEVNKGKISKINPVHNTMMSEVIDARNYTVIPGLIESHVHLSGMQTFDPYRRYFEPETTRLIRGLRHAEALLAAGYTTVRDLGGKGQGGPLKLIKKEGLFVGPRILTAIESISSTGGHGDWHVLPYKYVKESRLRALIADGKAECLQAVRFVIREGADVVKIHTSLGSVTNTAEDLTFVPSYSIEEIKTMCDEAHLQGKKVSTHAFGAEGIRNALLGGVDIIEHCYYDYEKNQDILPLILEKKATIVATLSLFKWTADEGKKYQAPNSGIKLASKALIHHSRFVKLAYDMGIPIATGTDENGVFGIARCALECKLMVEAGIAPKEVIRAATAIGAQTLGLDKIIGTIEPGKIPDLLILRKNPLNDIGILQDKSNIVSVFIGANN